MRPLVIELYCGTFGWSHGWLARGGRAVGFDLEHLPHHGEIPEGASLVLQDVRTLHGAQFKAAALILASPPCQEFSYRAMPWTRARSMPPPELGMELFAACFRIQREASAAAGRHIPMVVENVRGAQKWVGRAPAHFGSFYLWGDVPVLMPKPYKATKVPGFRFDGSKKCFQQAAVESQKGVQHRTAGHWTNPAEHEGTKVGGIDWSKGDSFNGTSEKRVREARRVRLANGNELDASLNEGRKAGGDWFGPGTDCSPMRKCSGSEGRKGFAARLGESEHAKTGSKSSARKAASAAIARIPERLSDWVAEVYFP